MKHILALLCLIPSQLIAVAAHGQTAGLRWNEDQLSWIPAPTCADGSPATDCPITSYRIETATSATATTWSLLTTPEATARAYKPTGLSAGLHCYRLAAISAGGQSAYTAVTPQMCATATPPAPGTPTLTVTDLVAYEIRQNDQGVLVAIRIGILPTGSVCNQDMREVNGVTFQSVDANAVEPFNTLQTIPPDSVFAHCG